MADRRVGGIGNGGSMGRRNRRKTETGRCNVCSAPCSSCMHRNAASKSDESSAENSHGVVVTSHCSFNEANALGKSSRNNTASVASNLVNSSNHDTTSSENDTSRCNVLPSEVKSQSDRKGRNISGEGKVKEKSGAENNDNKDKKNVLSESSTRSEQSGGKSGENSLLKKTEEPNTSAMSESENASESENESADSEMLEVDVKVCDICGDAGREDLLAICTRCNDGAEHTYCMRVMLKKVPEGDWLCEECKFAEEAEKKKLKHAESKWKRETEVNLNPSKRQIDKSEATAPDAKRQTVEAPTGSPKRSSLPRLIALPRETSFKGVVEKTTTTTTRKLAHHSSFNSHSSDDTESTRSTDSQKGSFLKSSSFNSRPKVRPVDDVVLPRRKENAAASLDVKEGFSSRNVDKSMSTRCTDVGKRKDDVDGLPRSREFREAGEKSSKDSVDNRQVSGSKGQNAESADMSTTTRNIREDMNKGNRLRAAVDAALRKKPSFSKNRGLDQSDLPPPSVSNVDSSCDNNKVTSKMPGTRDWPVGFQRTEKQTIAVRADPTIASQSLEPEAVKPFLRDWPVGLQQTDKQKIAVNGKEQPTLAGADPMVASQSIEPPEVRFVKPVTRDLPVVPSTILSTTSAIPEHEYIWQGDLEIQKSQNQSAMHSGIQAYLSTIASPKVAEVVNNQFPVKFALNEVPRLSTWPTQFQDNGAKEEHVALFFFAKDIESYEKSYKPLVDYMIQKDLALKGNLEGVELLIFPSNLLPQDCQRWNMLYFLWGVFRGRRKENCSNPLKNTPLPAPSNVLPNMGEKAFPSTREGVCGDNPSNRESSIDRASSRTQSCLKEENGKKDEAFGPKNVEEAEEGEIGDVVSSTLMKEEEKKKKTERIVFPLDLNDELALEEETTSIDGEEHRSSSNSNQMAKKNREEDDDDDDNAASLSLSLSFSSLEQQKKQKQKQNVNTPLFLSRDFPDKSSS